MLIDLKLFNTNDLTKNLYAHHFRFEVFILGCYIKAVKIHRFRVKGIKAATDGVVDYID